MVDSMVRLQPYHEKGGKKSGKERAGKPDGEEVYEAAHAMRGMTYAWGRYGIAKVIVAACAMFALAIWPVS